MATPTATDIKLTRRSAHISLSSLLSACIHSSPIPSGAAFLIENTGYPIAPDVMSGHSRRYDSVWSVSKYLDSKRKEKSLKRTLDPCPEPDICSIFACGTSNVNPYKDLCWYPRWIDRQLESLPEEVFSILPGHLSITQKDRYLRKFIDAFLEIANYIKSTTSVSIDSIAEHLSEKDLIHLENTTESLRLARTFVFAVLGWQTMLYRASWGTCPPGELAVVEEQNGFRGNAFMALRQEESACSRHDLPGFLIGFGVLLPAKNLNLDNPEDGQAFNRLLRITPKAFNASLLSAIGHLQIKWVDALSCHMEFDPITKELYLFRFPSFCKICLACREDENHQKSVIHSCASTSNDLREWASAKEVSHFLTEIMLSYCLLFGQTKQSRALFQSLKPFDDLPNNIRDPLLPLLCGTESPCLGENLEERDAYDLSQDFPVLRSRIVALQVHLSNTRPLTWSELWRDKRDSAQWLTFWAVIVFGGLGIILAFLQVVLQAIQLVLSR